MAKLQTGFAIPPDSVQSSVYWYWVSDNISKEGVVKDLKAMKSVGINRAFIGNIALPEVAFGKVKILSDEWWDILHTALKTAGDLNIQIGIFNSPGWSQSGGPWVKPQQAMRYLTSAEIKVKGPGLITERLLKPTDEFQDVQTIAFKAPKYYQQDISDLSPQISAEPILDHIANLTDHNQTTETALAPKSNYQLDFETKADFTLRSITIYPGHRAMKFACELQVRQGGGYNTISNFEVNRSNVQLIVGFNPYAPVIISVPAITARQYRLNIKTEGPASVSEVQLSSAPKVERYEEKMLAKMHPTPLPYWKEYQWAQQPVIDDQQLVIDPAGVVDISKFVKADGSISWQAPAGGDWVIRRIGMTPTKVTNSPASPEGRGPEADKMSKVHIRAHFDAFLGQIIKRIPARDRKTWKVVVEDSYETGGQNWTDDMGAEFFKVYGYHATPYLPVLQGNVVGSAAQSDRFLWDLRRLIADKVAYDYVGGLRQVSHENGLTTWLENYGHWGFPGEFLQYGGQSDEIGGEFWSEGELGNIENRAASSSAHIYGKTKVSAESFTCGGAAFSRYPAMMKQRADRFFTEGINNTLLHLYIQQPDDRLPGINAPFGNEFNRKNTWFDAADLFINYLKRCNLLLQQGRYVADVAYFIGEDAPKMTGVRDPELPQGYSFDYINAEVIKNRMAVKNGRLTLPDGLSYKILVLPKLETMRPELLRKITALVTAGAVVLGPAPKRSPSMQNAANADQEVAALAKQLWGNINGTTIKTHAFGKGLVINGMDMQEALNYLRAAPDCHIAREPVLFIHRKLPDSEIYFLSNQSEKAINIDPQFNIVGRVPELWDAVNGTTRQLPVYVQKDGHTEIPLQLAAYESAFIVFKAPIAGLNQPAAKTNFPDAGETMEIKSPWVVQFDAKMNGPAEPVRFDNLADWTLRPEKAIKYYSGHAVYQNSFDIPTVNNGQRFVINLGTVNNLAKVKINGIYAGGVWTAPYRVDVSKLLKPGKNTISIDVVNTWVNQIIGDNGAPEGQKLLFMNVNPYKADSKLQPSGLVGPVQLQVFNY